MTNEGQKTMTTLWMVIEAQGGAKPISLWKTRRTALQEMFHVIESGAYPEEWSDNYIAFGGRCVFINSIKVDKNETLKWEITTHFMGWKEYWGSAPDRTECTEFFGTVKEAFAEKARLQREYGRDRADVTLLLADMAGTNSNIGVSRNSK